jgi:arylsulfatase
MARFQEAFAGFLEHTDAQIERLVAGLDALGVLDDTVVVALSDNGASGEAGVFGTWNELIALNDFPAVADRSLEMLDDLGAENTYPLYPAGWAQAGNTPGKWYKHHTFAGGVRAPLIVRWPTRTGDAGRIDHGFCHAIDLAPTLLAAAGVPVPTEHRGLPQMPMHGTAIRLEQPDPTIARRTQYFEMGGHRGIYRDGWKAVTLHREGDDYAADRWELYRLDHDFSESHDLAAEFPDLLGELVDAWWVEAERFDVLPLDDRFVERAATAPPRSPFTVHRGAPRIAEAALPALMRRRWTMTCDIAERTADASGVLMSYGGRFGGIVLYVDGATLCLAVSYFGEIDDRARLGPLPAGAVSVRLTFEPKTTGADITLQAGDLPPERCTVTHVVPYYSGGNGLEVGAAPLSPVSPDPAAARGFTGDFPAVVFTFDDRPMPAEPDATRQLAAWVAAD